MSPFVVRHEVNADVGCRVRAKGMPGEPREKNLTTYAPRQKAKSVKTVYATKISAARSQEDMVSLMNSLHDCCVNSVCSDCKERAISGRSNGRARCGYAA